MGRDKKKVRGWRSNRGSSPSWSNSVAGAVKKAARGSLLRTWPSESREDRVVVWVEKAAETPPPSPAAVHGLRAEGTGTSRRTVSGEPVVQSLHRRSQQSLGPFRWAAKPAGDSTLCVCRPVARTLTAPDGAEPPGEGKTTSLPSQTGCHSEYGKEQRHPLEHCNNRDISNLPRKSFDSWGHLFSSHRHGHGFGAREAARQPDGEGMQGWCWDRDDILLCEEVEEQDLSAEERTFLEEFLILKEELEEYIRKLHALADHIDKTHETLTKASVGTNSVAVMSGALTFLGLALAPATAGGSVVLSTIGTGLGTAAGVTTALTNFWEQDHNQKAQDQASSLGLTQDQQVKEAGGDGQKPSYFKLVGKIAYCFGSAIRNIKKHIHDFKTARVQPHLAPADKALLTTGQVSAQRSRQVQNAFVGTIGAVTRNAHLLSSAVTGLYLGKDLAALLKVWKQLKEGAKSEFAKELRAKAGEQEKKLTELTQCHESLQQKKLLQEKRLMSSSSEGAVETLPQPPDGRAEAGSQEAGKSNTTEPRDL
ncbi:hypothetical protein HPG69_009818 [Diceros bicornis minor]|uniref:Apolipoprotein L6 n=1 Tax=Diceros bicornis minor TaxID=77932 RepID=A0A7J7EVK6_DICBM|nr:hypothetical protein HPG69_009818 [Diceros bicornis minor]